MGTLIGHQDIISALEFFCNDKKMFLASASLDKKIKIWDLNSYTMKNSFEVKSKVYDLICSKSNNALSIYSLHDKGEIIVWSDEVVRILIKLQKKGYTITEEPVFYRQEKVRKYGVHTKKECIGLPKDVCKYIATFI